MAQIALKPGVKTKLVACDASVSTGDLVYQDPAVNAKVLKVSDNLSPTPVIGKVLSKPGPTQAIILLEGIINESVNRGRMFVSALGVLTESAPSPGYLQTMGHSFGDGTAHFEPNLMRIKRI